MPVTPERQRELRVLRKLRKLREAATPAAPGGASETAPSGPVGPRTPPSVKPRTVIADPDPDPVTARTVKPDPDPAAARTVKPDPVPSGGAGEGGLGQRLEALEQAQEGLEERLFACLDLLEEQVYPRLRELERTCASGARAVRELGLATGLIAPLPKRDETDPPDWDPVSW